MIIIIEHRISFLKVVGFYSKLNFNNIFQVMNALPTVELDPPTISMTFGVNDSPLAGRDGSHVSLELLFVVFMGSDV